MQQHLMPHAESFKHFLVKYASVTAAAAAAAGCMPACHRALMATGAFHCVVRFNMRGAGRTSYRGSPAGVSELREVVQHLLDLPSLQQQQEQQQQQRQPGGKPQLYVVGYSYGSCIAAHAMQAFPEQVRRGVTPAGPTDEVATAPLDPVLTEWTTTPSNYTSSS
jgi:pimeloyl-ACP methyl ester carboxylesterase